MAKLAYFGVAIAAILGAGLHVGQASSSLSAVVVTPDPSHARADAGTWTFDTSSGPLVQIALEDGETAEGGTVQLLPAAAGQAGFKVQVQFQTQVAVPEQGPGGAVRDVKYFDSDWIDARALRTDRFRLPACPTSERRRFPNASDTQPFERAIAEIFDAWSPARAQATVGTSAMRIRVLAPGSAAWTEVFTIALKIQVQNGC